jgi:hypothetical protein
MEGFLRALAFALLFALSAPVSAQGSFAGDGVAVIAPATPAAEPLPTAQCDRSDTPPSFAGFGLGTSQGPLDACGSPVIVPSGGAANQPARIPTQLNEDWDFILQNLPGPPTLVGTLSGSTIATPSVPLELGASLRPSQGLASFSYDLPTLTTRPSVAENGSYYGQISELTGRPRTVLVRGYFRSDGTYVRGHYRSPPRR